MEHREDGISNMLLIERFIPTMEMTGDFIVDFNNFVLLLSSA